MRCVLLWHVLFRQRSGSLWVANSPNHFTGRVVCLVRSIAIAALQDNVTTSLSRLVAGVAVV